MRISFFSIPKPKSYSYQPRYYDEGKEQIENMRKKYRAANDGEKLQNMKASLNMHWRRKDESRTRQRSSAISLVVYAAIAALLLYIFLK